MDMDAEGGDHSGSDFDNIEEEDYMGWQCIYFGKCIQNKLQREQLDNFGGFSNQQALVNLALGNHTSCRQLSSTTSGAG